MGGPTTTTARDSSCSNGFQSSFEATPTEEGEGSNDDIINDSGIVVVGGMANKKKVMEEEEREKKEDFVKAVDDLLELVTKKFSRISRDMLGKSTSTTPIFICFIFFVLSPGETFSPPFDSYSGKLNFIFFTLLMV